MYPGQIKSHSYHDQLPFRSPFQFHDLGTTTVMVVVTGQEEKTKAEDRFEEKLNAKRAEGFP